MKNMNELKLLAIGSQVTIGEHKTIKATVSGVTIRADGYILYEVFFWNGETRTELWLTPLEVVQDVANVFTARMSIQ